MRNVALLAALALAALAAGAWHLINRPYANFGAETFVEIPRGAGTREIAIALRGGGVIGSPLLFVAMRALYPRRPLQAGEYRFHKPASTREVFGRLARGDVFFLELKIPEGWNVFQVGEAAERLGLFPAKAFVDAARDPSLIRDLAPRAPSLEGYLFPDTYRLGRHTTPAELCRQMTARFRQVWSRLGGRDAHAAATLASLVEKETGIADERALVASVFANRLRRGMKLDCDPTTIYAALIENRYRGAIHKSDLASSNAYNTYQHAGLPPGAIANPGAAALEAALHPAETGYLYFVARADGSGRHQFSADIAEHQAATEKYRRAVHKADKKTAGKRMARRPPARRNP